MTTDETLKIFSEIESSPPLMRGKARAALVGKEVDWTAEFFSGELEGAKRAFIAFRHAASDKMLFASVDLDDYPWLLSCQRGETVRVQGQISKVEPLSIALKAVSLAQISGTVREALGRGGSIHG